MTQLLQSGAISQSTYDQTQSQIGDALGLLDGETAVALLPTDLQALGQFNTNSYGGDTRSLPLAALVNTSTHPNALGTVRALLDRAFYQGGDGGYFNITTTAHGNTMYLWPGGWGYAVIGNWLVASPSIAQVASSMEGVLYDRQPSLAASDPFTQARAALQGPKGMVMLIDLGAVRAAFDNWIASQSYETQQQYQNARPWLAPLGTLAVSSGTTSDGTASTTDLFLGING